MCNACTSCLVCDTFISSIPFLDPALFPYVCYARPIGRQIDRQPDTTHSNTTGQRRKNLVGFVRWNSRCQCARIGVTSSSTDWFY